MRLKITCIWPLHELSWRWEGFKIQDLTTQSQNPMLWLWFNTYFFQISSWNVSKWPLTNLNDLGIQTQWFRKSMHPLVVTLRNQTNQESRFSKPKNQHIIFLRFVCRFFSIWPWNYFGLTLMAFANQEFEFVKPKNHISSISDSDRGKRRSCRNKVVSSNRHHLLFFLWTCVIVSYSSFMINGSAGQK